MVAQPKNGVLHQVLFGQANNNNNNDNGSNNNNNNNNTNNNNDNNHKEDTKISIFVKIFGKM